MSIRTGPVRWHGWWVLVVWGLVRVLVGLWRVLLTAVCRPRATCVVVGALLLVGVTVTHPRAVAAGVLVAVVAFEVWLLLAPARSRRRAELYVLGLWRSAVVYRRLWRAAVGAAELTVDGRVPQLGRVRCLDRVDVLRVRGLLGQRFASWEAAGPMLAHVFGASDVRVHRGDDRRLTIELVRAERGGSWHRDGVLDLDQRPAPSW